MKIGSLAVAFIFGLGSSAAFAGSVPVMITGSAIHYSDVDKQTTGRVIAIASRNPTYSIIPSASTSAGQPPFVDVLLIYTDLSDGIIVLSVEVLLHDRRLQFDGHLSNGVTFCSVADQAQCILDAGTILQTGFNNYLDKTMK